MYIIQSMPTQHFRNPLLKLLETLITTQFIYIPEEKCTIDEKRTLVIQSADFILGRSRLRSSYEAMPICHVPKLTSDHVPKLTQNVPKLTGYPNVPKNYKCLVLYDNKYRALCMTRKAL